MKFRRIVVGELLLLVASVLVFRSTWSLLDQYLGPNLLWPLLIVGVVGTVVALWILNREAECQINDMKNAK